MIRRLRQSIGLQNLKRSIVVVVNSQGFSVNALVFYYSRTRTTRKAAEKLASLLKCASEEICETKNRKGILGWLSTGKTATRKELTKLEKVQNDPTSFDMVVVGVWNHTMSTAIKTYLTQYKDSFRKVAFFCTHQYTDDDPFEEMASLCGKTPVATLTLLRKKEVEVDQFTAKVEEFVARLASEWFRTETFILKSVVPAAAGEYVQA